MVRLLVSGTGDVAAAPTAGRRGERKRRSGGEQPAARDEHRKGFWSESYHGPRELAGRRESDARPAASVA